MGERGGTAGPLALPGAACFPPTRARTDFPPLTRNYAGWYAHTHLQVRRLRLARAEAIERSVLSGIVRVGRAPTWDSAMPADSGG